jgi:AcrR family transcriptional regulator
MAPVNKRAYSSPVRQEQAALTRQRILDAAGDLFVSLGYARTTIRQIAEVANVSPDTVYAVFGSKARVLTALIDQRLAPSPGVENVLDRPEATSVRDETDQRRQIQQFARDMAAVSTRVRPVYEILRTASAVEPEMAVIRAEMDAYRLRNMTQVAQWIAAHGPLRVDVERAGEIIWALASPDMSRMLCDDRGWTQDQFASWLEHTLVSVLLPVDDRS